MLNSFASWIKDTIAIEHSRQGHTLTGAAEKTLQYQITTKGTVTEIAIFGQSYMRTTEQGVYADQTGSWESQRDGLINYSKLRFKVGDKESKKIAYLIWRKHTKEGNPTKASYKFSTTGKRTQYIQDVINSDLFQQKFEEYYDNQIIKELEIILT